jgi:hypothetical protein
VTTEPTTTTPTADTDGAADLVRTAVEYGLAASNPYVLGDSGLAFVVPPGHNVHTERVDQFEDLPRHRTGTFKFVGVRSLAAYVIRYKTGDTLGYVHDVYGQGPRALLADVDVADYVLDDHPTDAAANRAHRATLVLRPTTAARRWGAALAAPSLSQEHLLDLVVDGIGEIASPDAAILRDLIADLHAIRQTSARSVIRSGGGATVEVADNVTLSAGTGNRVEVPPAIHIVFTPYAGIPGQLSLEVALKPTVRDEKVTFSLHAPGLDDGLARIVGDVTVDLTAQTSIEPLWIP